jgi:hypothetical protein
MEREFSFYSMVHTMEVPASLRGPGRRRALELVEEALFGRICDRADPSLAWLLASRKRLLWIDGVPRVPASYTVRLAGSRLSALVKGNVALETAVFPLGGDELWITYAGGVHGAAPRELVREGEGVILGTAHGVIATDPRQSKHAWIYVHQDPEAKQKLRTPSILGARIHGPEVVIDVDPFFGPASDGRDVARKAAFRVHVDLATGTVSHAFDDQALAALRRHEKSCEQGVATGCVLKDEALCEQGDHLACLSAAARYDGGQGVPPDHSKQARLYEAACDAGSRHGCYNAALAYQNGEGVARDEARAAPLYDSACEEGIREACTNLGALFENGQGVAKDLSRARALYTTACNWEDAAGCNDLALVHEEGKGIPVDLETAARLYRKSCSLGLQPACDDARRLDRH